MYQDFFGFCELPFSIVPNSRFLYLSQRHKEAITHIQAGFGEGGGFALLTGEVGTGKTTVAKAILSVVGDETQAGLILNPTFSSQELLEAICDELSIEYPENATLKSLNNAIYQHLLSNHANGQQTLLVIDEAQHLSADVLEQLRLLTNLETDSRKLIKVLLIGQPELQHKLKMPQLRQLAQRITGRYHLLPLNKAQVKEYVQFRLERAGGNQELFSNKCLNLIAENTQGIPRLINLVCDASLKQSHQIGEMKPTAKTVAQACELILSLQGYSTVAQVSVATKSGSKRRYSVLAPITALALSVGLGWLSFQYTPIIVSEMVDKQVQQQLPPLIEQQVEQQVVPDELLNALATLQSREQGIKQLYQVWGYRASVMDQLCSQESEGMFRCKPFISDLEALERINLPVLLNLDVEGNAAYAILVGVEEETVTLQTDAQQITLAKQDFLQYWQGEGYLIWQAYWQQSLKLGAKGSSVLKLDEHLSALLDEEPTQSDEFDMRLKRKVELFQRWQGLDVDGIAGQKTLQRLERLSQFDAPSIVKNEEGA
ncbi:ExeA family protein [Vibrio maerlii]|uniref:ExeA family protein n=1 Tax=Vibrio maerlii TaxID=2231648 RepID=UPI000E3EAA2E|nr:ExeA family protein [Vibrio maerlii]